MPARSHGSGSAPVGADPISYTKIEDTPIVYSLFVFIRSCSFVRIHFVVLSFMVLSISVPWFVALFSVPLERYASPFLGWSSSLSRR